MQKQPEMSGTLMDALDAPGSGELVHPDPTVDVMVDSWECRTKADELELLRVHRYRLSVAAGYCPDAETDTSAAVPAQAVAVTGSLWEIRCPLSGRP